MKRIMGAIGRLRAENSLAAKKEKAAKWDEAITNIHNLQAREDAYRGDVARLIAKNGKAPSSWPAYQRNLVEQIFKKHRHGKDPTGLIADIKKVMKKYGATIAPPKKHK